ncbi:MAG: DUF2344 domain-containing protein [Chloroflexota bacterium]|nr:DUF2344 domain-containing protein [Chloroflexota bacterium]
MTSHPSPSDEPVQPPQRPPREPFQRWRLVLARSAVEPDQAQRSQQEAWEAALVRSGLPVAGMDGPRGRPRFASAAPLAAAIPGEGELVDVWLIERLPRWRVREALARVLPLGHTLVDVQDVWLGEAPLPGRVSASVYCTVLGPGVDADAVRAVADALCATTSLPRERRKGESMVAYDLRPFVEAIEVTDAADSEAFGSRPGAGPGSGAAILRMTLRHDPEKGVGRPEELLAALEERAGFPLKAHGLVRERLVLADRANPVEPPRTRGPRPRPGAENPRPVRGPRR